jgi:ADP-ribose pyrophosphatase
MSKRPLSTEVREKVLLHEGFFRLYRYLFEVERHEGGTDSIVREVVERGDAVAILAYDAKRDEVVLGNEFRPGVQVAGEYPYRDGLVAGGIEDGETVIDAAVREMQEEAGLELRQPIIIHQGAFASSGGASERIALVFGFVDTSHAGGVHGNREEQEDILTVVLPAEEFIARVRAGEIDDLKTLVAGYWLAERRAVCATSIGPEVSALDG